MKKVFWGLFFILSAVLIIVNELGYYTHLNLFTLLFTIFMIPILVTSLYKVNFIGIFFSVAILGILYAKPLGIESLVPVPILLVAALLSIGFSIIFKHSNLTIIHSEKFDEVINEADGESVNLGVSFGSSIKYINSEDFKKANISCSFGAMKVYFDNAKIVDDEATVKLDISFSGVELYIPKEYKIVNKIDVLLGGVEEKNISRTKAEKTIILTGRVSLSGVEIIYI